MNAKINLRIEIRRPVNTRININLEKYESHITGTLKLYGKSYDQIAILVETVQYGKKRHRNGRSH